MLFHMININTHVHSGPKNRMDQKRKWKYSTTKEFSDDKIQNILAAHLLERVGERVARMLELAVFAVLLFKRGLEVLVAALKPLDFLLQSLNQARATRDWLHNNARGHSGRCRADLDFKRGAFLVMASSLLVVG